MISINFFNILATVINILVLFLLMQKFLFKPLMNVMQKREELIQSQFQKARDTESDANDLKVKYEDSLKGAHEESQAIIDRAKISAQAEYDRIVNEADDKAKNIVTKARSQAEMEKDQTLKEVKSELGDLIALAAGKIAETKVTAESDKELIEKFLADAENQDD